MNDVRSVIAGDSVAGGTCPILNWRLFFANPHTGCQASNVALPPRLGAKPPVTFMPQAVDSHSEVG
jgi:hypothetical protein